MFNGDGIDKLIIIKSNINYCVYSYEGTISTISVTTSVDKELINVTYYAS